MKLNIHELTKKFGRKIVLNNLDFHLESNIYGLLGPNGSGKTTLMRILTGLIEPTSGSVSWIHEFKQEIKQRDVKIGYLPQRFGLFKELTVQEHMRYFANLKNIPICEQGNEIESALVAVHLIDQQKCRCNKLSGGMIRRLGIAQALMGNPDIVLFDEPTAGLDPEERLRFKNLLINWSGRCPVILSTHIVDDVESVCDRVIILNEGKILVECTLNELAINYRSQNLIEPTLEDSYMLLIKGSMRDD